MRITVDASVEMYQAEMYFGAVVTAGQLYRLSRLLREVALTVSAEPDETPPPFGLVAVTDDIAHHDGTTVGEITARTGLAQSLVSKSVAQLRQAGVVHTRPDDTDRRRTRIHVTAAARSEVFVTRGGRSITDALHQRFPDLPTAQITAIEDLLERLVAEVQEQSQPSYSDAISPTA